MNTSELKSKRIAQNKDVSYMAMADRLFLYVKYLKKLIIVNDSECH